MFVSIEIKNASALCVLAGLRHATMPALAARHSAGKLAHEQRLNERRDSAKLVAQKARLSLDRSHSNS